MLFAIIQGQPDPLLDHRLQTIHGRVHQTRLARYFGQLWLRIAQDVVPGWLPRIANGPFQSWRYPRIASWGIFSRPYGTESFLEPLPRTHVLGYTQPSLRDSIGESSCHADSKAVFLSLL